MRVCVCGLEYTSLISEVQLSGR